ncbi:hypothetical protein ACEQPO_09995 [Bacillus sp. SL00103]
MYLLKALKVKGNHVLHITSTHALMSTLCLSEVHSPSLYVCTSWLR